MSLSDLISGSFAAKKFGNGDPTKEFEGLAELALAAPARETTTGDDRLAFPSSVTHSVALTPWLGKHISLTELAKLSGLALANPDGNLHDQGTRSEIVKPPATRSDKEIADPVRADDLHEAQPANQTLTTPATRVNSMTDTDLANANNANAANSFDRITPALRAKDTTTAREWVDYFSNREPSSLGRHPPASRNQLPQDVTRANEACLFNGASIQHIDTENRQEADPTERRTIMIESRRIPAADAARLAARLLARDQDLDDRKMCVECTQLVGNYCHSGLEPIGGGRTVLHRCIKFIGVLNDATD